MIISIYCLKYFQEDKIQMHTQGKGETTLLQFNSNLRFYKNPKAMIWMKSGQRNINQTQNGLLKNL